MGLAALVPINREFVLRKCALFQDVHLWPLRQELDPERWLSNFLPSEIDHAVHLLNAFMYFSREVMNQMMIAAFQGLSHLQWWGNEPYISSRAGWRSFVDSVLITCVTGERPSDTDSGHHFQRMARQVLGIPEQRILSPEDTLREILNHGPRCVVFVDDFVGSGRQFRTTWARDVAVTKSASISFQKVASIMPDNRFFYCPLICTRHGERVVRNKCPEVEVCPAHFLEPEYGALSPDSFVWPDHLRASAYTFLEQASARAGIADTEWRGIDDLGLVLAFEHSVPDAALKMIYWEKNNWKPLVRRK